jgi:hypothetical protein
MGAAFSQIGLGNANCALGTAVITRVVDAVVGQAPFPAKVMVYCPGVLAAILIWPVAVLTKTRPAGEALNVPPEGLLMTGVGFGDEVQYVPEPYWNCGLATLVIETVTAVRVLGQPPVVCSA